MVKSLDEHVPQKTSSLERIRDIILSASTKGYDQKLQRQEIAIEKVRSELRDRLKVAEAAMRETDRVARRERRDGEKLLSTRQDGLDAAVQALKQELEAAGQAIQELRARADAGARAFREEHEASIRALREEVRQLGGELTGLFRQELAEETAKLSGQTAHGAEELGRRLEDVRDRLAGEIASLTESAISRQALGEALLALGAQLLGADREHPRRRESSPAEQPCAAAPAAEAEPLVAEPAAEPEPPPPMASEETVTKPRAHGEEPEPAAAPAQAEPPVVERAPAPRRKGRKTVRINQ